MLSLQPNDQSQSLVPGQGLYSLCFEAVSCLALLHLSDDAKGAKGPLAPIFGGSPVRDRASYLALMALFFPCLRQGAGDGDNCCQSLGGMGCCLWVSSQAFRDGSFAASCAAELCQVTACCCLEFQGGNTTRHCCPPPHPTGY